jgi:hypothetical protein
LNETPAADATRRRRPLRLGRQRPIVLASCGVALKRRIIMRRSPLLFGLIAAASLAFAPASSSGVAIFAQATSPGAATVMPRLYRSCTNYNKKYPHGVGRLLARDKVRPGNEPVTTFRRSNRLFRIAMSWNRGLDRDKDRIACEKR